jgi:hypothetical protein
VDLVQRDVAPLTHAAENAIGLEEEIERRVELLWECWFEVEWTCPDRLTAIFPASITRILS